MMDSNLFVKYSSESKITNTSCTEYFSRCPQSEDVFCSICMSRMGGSQTCHVLSEVTGCGPANTMGGWRREGGICQFAVVVFSAALWQYYVSKHCGIMAHSSHSGMTVGNYRMWSLFYLFNSHYRFNHLI